MQVFNIHIEFNPEVVRKTVEEHIQQCQKGYVCVIESSVIANVQESLDYRKVVNDAFINICDGSSISMMVNRIYGTNFQVYSGPDIFEYYIEKPYRHLLLGNTIQKAEHIKSVVKKKGYTVDIKHLDVPFMSVDEFDYEDIARNVNEMHSDIIWVSLGNPKQEIFMNRLLPYLDKGVMFGIGAAFNFYTGDFHNNKRELGGLRFIWLERLIKEPKKNLKRIKHDIPFLCTLYREEKERAKKSNN